MAWKDSIGGAAGQKLTPLTGGDAMAQTAVELDPSPDSVRKAADPLLLAEKVLCIKRGP